MCVWTQETHLWTHMHMDTHAHGLTFPWGIKSLSMESPIPRGNGQGLWNGGFGSFTWGSPMRWWIFIINWLMVLYDQYVWTSHCHQLLAIRYKISIYCLNYVQRNILLHKHFFLCRLFMSSLVSSASGTAGQPLVLPGYPPRMQISTLKCTSSVSQLV